MVVQRVPGDWPIDAHIKTHSGLSKLSRTLNLLSSAKICMKANKERHRTSGMHIYLR